MKNRTVAWMCLGAIAAAALAGVAWYYPRLPDMVASHFNARGEADGWTGKQSFALMQAGAIGFVALVFVPLVLFLPRIPKSMVNLPHRDYWLAPERADQTCREVGDTLLWFATVKAGI
jgi:uncharacterized membrane protein